MGSKSSKSTSTATTNTTNIDRRQVVAEGATGIAADGATVNVTNNSVDKDIVMSALDAVKADDATNGAGFTQLLTLADKLFSGAGDVISKTQDTTIKQLDQIQTAANDAKGAIDQKTLIIVAGAALGLMALRKK